MTQHGLPLFLSAILSNNIVLWYCLGLCPLLGLSGAPKKAALLGANVVFVATLCFYPSWLIQHFFLVPLSLRFLRAPLILLVVFGLSHLALLAASRSSLGWAREAGHYLPFTINNCAVFGLLLQASDPAVSSADGFLLTLGGSIGFLLVAVLLGGIGERVAVSLVPSRLKGFPSELISAGLLALVFLGFRSFNLGW